MCKYTVLSGYGVFSKKCLNVGGERQTGIPITAHAQQFRLGQKIIAKLLRTLTGLFLYCLEMYLLPSRHPCCFMFEKYTV